MDQLSFVKPVKNVPAGALNLPVGARLQSFWETLEALGAGPKVLKILKHGYILPFQIRLNLTRSPTFISCYANLHKNLSLLEALHQLMAKNAELVHNQKSQSTLLGSKTKQPLETHTGPEQTKSFPQGGKIQNGDTTNHQNIPPTRGVGYLNRFQGRLLPHTNTGTIQEISEILCSGSDISSRHCHSRLSTPPMEFTVKAKEVKLMAIHKGIRIHQYLDDWLVRARSHQPCLQHTQDLVVICQKLGWLVNVEKSELEGHRTGGRTFNKNTGTSIPTSLSGPEIHVPYKSANSHIKSSSPQPTTYETHTVASQKQLEGTGITRKGHSHPQVLASHPQWWLEESNVLHGQPLHPLKHALQIFTDASKQGWGAHLNEHTCKRNSVPSKKQAAYKLFGTKGGFPGPKIVPKPLLRQDSSCSNQQHHSCFIHKQGRRHEVGFILCTSTEDADMVFQKTGYSQSPTHPRP